MAGFTVNGITFKSKKAYFYVMNPDVKNATQNDIDRYLYHNLPEYHHKKRGYYRQKYRTLKGNKVRPYTKYSKDSEYDFVSSEDIQILINRVSSVEPVKST